MRHLQEVNRRLEKKYLMEQDEKIKELPDVEITGEEPETKDLDSVTIYGTKQKNFVMKSLI